MGSEMCIRDRTNRLKISPKILPYIMARGMEWVLKTTEQKDVYDWESVVKQIEKIDENMIRGWLKESMDEGIIARGEEPEITFEDVLFMGELSGSVDPQTLLKSAQAFEKAFRNRSLKETLLAGLRNLKGRLRINVDTRVRKASRLYLLVTALVALPLSLFLGLGLTLSLGGIGFFMLPGFIISLISIPSSAKMSRRLGQLSTLQERIKTGFGVTLEKGDIEELLATGQVRIQDKTIRLDEVLDSRLLKMVRNQFGEQFRLLTTEQIKELGMEEALAYVTLDTKRLLLNVGWLMPEKGKLAQVKRALTLFSTLLHERIHASRLQIPYRSPAGPTIDRAANAIIAGINEFLAYAVSWLSSAFLPVLAPFVYYRYFRPEAPSPSELPDDVLINIKSVPLKEVGRGSQFIVYSSDKLPYVVKVLRRGLGPLSYFDRKIALNGYRVAWEKFQEQTGIRGIADASVLGIDSKYRAVIQNKVVPLKEKIKALAEQGKMEEARSLIKGYFELLDDIRIKGIYNLDEGREFTEQFGYDEVSHKVVLMDPGMLTDKRWSLLAVLTKIASLFFYIPNLFLVAREPLMKIGIPDQKLARELSEYYKELSSKLIPVQKPEVPFKEYVGEPMWGVKVQEAKLKEAIKDGKRYYDVAMVTTKKAHAEIFVRALEEARGRYIPEASRVIRSDRGREELLREVREAREKGEAVIVVCIEPDGVKGNWTGTVNALLRLREAGVDFGKELVGIVHTAGSGTRNYPGTATSGYGNKALMKSINGELYIYQSLKQLMQYYEEGLKGVLITSCDGIKSISQPVEVGKQGIQILGSALEWDDPALSGYGTIKVDEDGGIEKLIEKPRPEVVEKEFGRGSRVPTNWADYYISGEAAEAILEVYSREGEVPAELMRLDTAMDLFEAATMDRDAWVNKGRAAEVWELAQKIKERISLGFVDTGAKAIFADTGNNESFYGMVQELFEDETLRALLGIELRGGALIGKEVELGKEVEVEAGAAVLGRSRILRGRIERGAVVIDVAAENLIARKGSMLMSVEQLSRGELEAREGQLISDVFVKEGGKVRVVSDVSLGVKDKIGDINVWEAKLWPRSPEDYGKPVEEWSQSEKQYSFKELATLVDPAATERFLSAMLNESLDDLFNISLLKEVCPLADTLKGIKGIDGIVARLDSSRPMVVAGAARELLHLQYLRGAGYEILEAGKEVFNEKGRAVTDIDGLARSPDGTLVITEAKSFDLLFKYIERLSPSTRDYWVRYWLNDVIEDKARRFAINRDLINQIVGEKVEKIIFVVDFKGQDRIEEITRKKIEELSKRYRLPMELQSYEKVRGPLAAAIQEYGEWEESHTGVTFIEKEKKLLSLYKKYQLTGSWTELFLGTVLRGARRRTREAVSRLARLEKLSLIHI